MMEIKEKIRAPPAQLHDGLLQKTGKIGEYDQKI